MNKNYLLTIAAIGLFLLSGCWDSVDIQKEDIHISEAIDYKDGLYHFHGEVADMSGQSQNSENSQGGQNFLISNASGKTLTETRDNLERKSSNPVYLGACKILIFSDRLSELGVEEYLNRSRTQHNTRKSLKIITTSDELEEFLNVKTDNSAFLGFAVDNMLENMIKTGSSFNVDIGNLLEALAVKKVGFLIPAVNIENENITLTGYTVFKNAKKIGLISAEDRKGIVYFLNPKARFNYEIKKDSEIFQLETSLKRKKIKTSYDGNQVTIKVQMDFSTILNYMNKIHPISTSDKDELQALLSEVLKQDILSALETSQKQYALDYLEIYRYFRAQNNRVFKNINWQQAYADAAVEVEVNATINLSELPRE